MTPKVSICIPAYRQPDKLSRALRSICSQSFRHFEVVVTDDSPDDAVEKVCAEFGKFTKLRYHKNDTTMGSPRNWNEAIRLSSGEYIKLLHHDDWFRHETSLAELVAMLDHDQKADMAFCSSLVCDSEQSILFTHAPSKRTIGRLRSDPRVLFQGNSIGSPSATIYRRVAGEEYDSKMKWLVDIDFYIRLLSKNKHFCYTSDALVCIGVSGDSVTATCIGNKSVNLFEYLYLYKKLLANGRLGFRYDAAVWRVFAKYGVTSRQDLEGLDLDLNGLPALDRIILIQQIFQKVGLLKLLALCQRSIG